MGISYDDNDDIKIKGGTDDTIIGNINDRLKVDAIVINEDKERLEAGQAFALNIQYVLSNGQTKYHSFITPNSATRIHFKFKTYSAGRSAINLFESPTVNAYDFSWTPRDRNRETANSSSMTVQAITSVSSAGTFLLGENNYGSGLAVSSSQILTSPEFILAPNTEYLIGMTSYEASNLTTVQTTWYEV